MWRRSLDAGEMPEGTILAHITPICKKGNRGLPVNYRPIALTNHVTKSFERVLRKAILIHLEENTLLNISQHGFRSGFSTVSQLLTYYDSILTLLESEGPIDAIYLDFAKAFDKVDHSVLLMKLHRLGITGKIHSWIKNFLTNRMQQVKVHNALSDPVKTRSGVPQGSVLGPLLFLIMMIDIDDQVQNCSIATFADDTKVWCPSQVQTANVLQLNLSSLYEWARSNNMEFNDDKFDYIQFDRTPSPSAALYHTPSGAKINQVSKVKDLGVWVSGDLLFSSHVKEVVSGAQNMAHWVL